MSIKQHNQEGTFTNHDLDIVIQCNMMTVNESSDPKFDSKVRLIPKLLKSNNTPGSGYICQIRLRNCQYQKAKTKFHLCSNWTMTVRGKREEKAKSMVNISWSESMKSKVHGERKLTFQSGKFGKWQVVLRMDGSDG